MSSKEGSGSNASKSGNDDNASDDDLNKGMVADTGSTDSQGSAPISDSPADQPSNGHEVTNESVTITRSETMHVVASNLTD